MWMLARKWIEQWWTWIIVDGVCFGLYIYKGIYFYAALYGFYTIIKKFVNPDVPMGFSSLMAAVVFFGGMIMVMLGLIGEYVGRIYISMNNSPQYVIREQIGDQKNEEGM